MQDILSKTFGGLSKRYYFRQLFFSLVLFSLVIYLSFNGNKTLDFYTIIFFVVNAILYPYSRFVYESIIEFILGDNIFFVNVIFGSIVKLLTMSICWFFGIAIAPLGLVYLYFYHSKTK
ncbi:MAG: hypothetical protein HRT41_02440 [Campylobacteraceae bacterium]|nr:hypothetical protein [Campylobacteraceae bacterium]